MDPDRDYMLNTIYSAFIISGSVIVAACSFFGIRHLYRRYKNNQALKNYRTVRNDVLEENHHVVNLQTPQ